MRMALASCPRCKKLFPKIRNPICPACEPVEEEDFEKVREYLAENQGSALEETSKATGVDKDCVRRLLADGRIGFASEASIPCGMCGAPAISAAKRLCQACLGKLNKKLAQEQSKIRLPQRKDVQIGGHMALGTEEEDEGHGGG